MKKYITILFTLLACKQAFAQIDLKSLKISDLLGKTMTVKKGWAPKFSLNNQGFNKIANVAQIFGVKDNSKATKLFNTFKTGRTIYRIAGYISTASSVYGAIKSLDKAALKNEYQGAIKTALGSLSAGVLVKLLTKGAAEKAKNEFNGQVKKKIAQKVKDLISINASQDQLGLGLFVKLTK